MKKNQLGLLFFATIIFIACGGSDQSSENNEADADNTEETMADMDHADTESNVAEMIPAPEGARVYFGNLEDGAEVTSPVFGV